MTDEPEQECCPVCKTVAPWKNKGGGAGWNIICPRCGNFDIGWIAAKSLEQFSAIQRANLSGWIRENQGCQIAERDLSHLKQLRTPTVAQKADKLLLFFAQKHPKPGEVIDLTKYRANFYDGGRLTGGTYGEALYGVCWCQDKDEFNYISKTFLRDEKVFLTAGQYSSIQVLITPSGWAYLHSLIQENAASSLGFVAMWFDKSVDQAYLAVC